MVTLSFSHVFLEKRNSFTESNNYPLLLIILGKYPNTSKLDLCNYKVITQPRCVAENSYF